MWCFSVYQALSSSSSSSVLFQALGPYTHKTLNLWKEAFSVFFLQFSATAHISRMNCSAMAGNRLEKAAYESFMHRMHIYNHLSFGLLNSRSLSHGGYRFGYSFNTCFFFIFCTLYTDSPDGMTAAVARYVSFVTFVFCIKYIFWYFPPYLLLKVLRNDSLWGAEIMVKSWQKIFGKPRKILLNYRVGQNWHHFVRTF